MIAKDRIRINNIKYPVYGQMISLQKYGLFKSMYPVVFMSQQSFRQFVAYFAQRGMTYRRCDDQQYAGYHFYKNEELVGALKLIPVKII